ncbi:hypothetical protein OS493_011835 [Desmophyllum pertusum]|uniref:Phosphatidylethanolamine-binding protein n=1 Tax=Desmophyllum pertusum TaxID=174260 RepID=A0A9W9YDX8_9CNID|nr:hypothetical protein OS493_011835 [Desmophyllum pertusum]
MSIMNSRNPTVVRNLRLDELGAVAPTVTVPNADPGKKYSIVMVDPDAPSASNPTCQSWLHWIIGNIKGDDLAKEILTTLVKLLQITIHLVLHQGPGPHRYYLYVFEQEHQLDNSAKVSASSRCQFSIDSYKKNFGLNAVAMNMFTTVTPENP